MSPSQRRSTIPETISHPPFTGIHNFRDVGLTINTLLSTPLLKPGVLFRSTRLDNATPDDRALLSSHYGVKTVLDLRTKSEHIEQARVLGKHGARKENRYKAAAEVATETDPLIEAERALWETERIDMVGKGLQKHWLKQLGWWDLLCFVVLMLLQFRPRALRILGSKVLGPRGLVGLSKDTLTHCQPEILSALNILVTPSTTPALVHCTQGKDRSGLIVMLSLFICNVPVSAVREDYMLSNQGLDALRERMVEEVAQIGMGRGYTEAPGEVVDEVWGYLEEQGGVERYLDGVGFGEDERKRLREVLME